MAKKVTPLSPSFLLMLTFAVVCDLLDIFINFFELLVGGSIPAISSVVDFIAAITIGIWLRSHGVTPTKGSTNVKKSGGSEKKAEESGVVGKSKAYIKQIIISFLIEQIPFIGGLAPTWTLNVISVLEEKRTIYLIIAMTVIFSPIILMTLADMLKPDTGGEVCGINQTGGQCGFDRSKLDSLYGGEGYNTSCNNGGPIVSYTEVRDNDIHKQYAIDNLGVTEEEIQEYSGADQDAREKKIADLIRSEVAKQWSELTEEEKKGCTQLDAERGILTYAFGELDGLTHFEASGGRLRPYCEDCGGMSTLQPLSVTNDKYNKCYNRQVGAMWDIKYTVYLGVKEHFNNWKGIANNGNCEDMWGQERMITSVTDWTWPVPSCNGCTDRNCCDYPYLGERYNKAVQKAKQYAQSEYVCQGGNLSNASTWYMSMCERMVSTNAPNWPDAATCRPGGNKRCTNPSLSPTKNCDFDEQRLEVNCLPLACEEVSTAMVVKFYGNEIDAKTLWEKIGGCQSDLDNIPLIASSYGINCQALQESELNKDGIKKYLDQGIPVIAKGGIGSFGRGEYTYHVVVITGIEGDNFVVNDPAFNPGPGTKYSIRTWASEKAYSGQGGGKAAWACTR